MFHRSPPPTPRPLGQFLWGNNIDERAFGEQVDVPTLRSVLWAHHRKALGSFRPGAFLMRALPGPSSASVSVILPFVYLDKRPRLPIAVAQGFPGGAAMATKRRKVKSGHRDPKPTEGFDAGAHRDQTPPLQSFPLQMIRRANDAAFHI